MARLGRERLRTALDGDGIEQRLPDPEDRKTRTARRFWEKAEGGDRETWIAIMDRMDGKAVQPIAGDDTYPPVSVRLIEVFEDAADGGYDPEPSRPSED